MPEGDMTRRRTRGFSIVLFVALWVSSAAALASGFGDLKEARAAGQRGEYESAIHFATRAIKSGELSPENRAIAFGIRGKAWSEEKNYGRAIADFTEALHLKPRYGYALYNRAIAWQHRGDYNRAIADYTEVIRLKPKVARLFYDRGFVWYLKKDFGRAIADYTKAIRLNPKDAEAFYSRAIAWHYKGDLDHAIADYTEAIRLKPKTARLYFDRGNAWFQKQNYHRAIADYTEAIRLDPKHAVLFYSRGNAWFHQQHYRRAIANYAEALRLKPKFRYALNNRGFAQFYLARFRRAAADFAELQKLQPYDAYTAIWLYLARARAGARNAASALSESVRRFKRHRWPAPIIALYTGKIDAKAALKQAAGAAPIVKKRQTCEANFYVGQWYLLKHQRGQARTLFHRAKDECQKGFVEYAGAVAALKRM